MNEDRQAELQSPGSDIPPKLDTAALLRQADERVKSVRNGKKPSRDVNDKPSRDPSPKPSQNIDSPSSQDRSSNGIPVREFNKTKHPVDDKPSMNVEKAPHGGKYVGMIDKESKFRKPDEIPTIERGQSGANALQSLRPGIEVKHGNILVKTGGIIEGLNNDQPMRGRSPVGPDDFETNLKNRLPPELLNASWNLAGLARPAAGKVLKVSEAGDGCETEWGDCLSVYGTPALYKGIFLRGWSKASAEEDWVAMTVAQETATPPTKLDTAFVDGVDAYPWCAWRPTWDWARVGSGT